MAEREPSEGAAASYFGSLLMQQSVQWAGRPQEARPSLVLGLGTRTRAARARDLDDP